jgi:glutamate racemase
MQNLPIGIFDSGIGGLTVAHALKEKLPNESIVYFGDTEHLPYGEKSAEALRNYSKKITQFLLEKNCKCIVIACNSASSVAFDVVKKTVKNIPVFNVIDPVIEKVSNSCNSCKVGVIGTKATISSNIYKNKLNVKCPRAVVTALATPLLAPMIEEKFIGGDISKKIIANYLSNKKLQEIDQLILACTHYPLIYKEIRDYFKGEVIIINSTNIVAEHIASELKNKTLLNNQFKPKYKFYVSNYTKAFEKSARFFFQEKIKLREANIWT